MTNSSDNGSHGNVNELIFVNAPKMPSGKRPDGAPSIRSMMLQQLVRKKKANAIKRLIVRKPGFYGVASVSDSAARNTNTPPLGESDSVRPADVAGVDPVAAAELHARESSSDSERSQVSPPSLLTVLSEARSDPFSHWYSELGHRGHEVLDFCISEFWPTLRTHDYAEQCYRDRFHQGSRLTLYCVLWATSVHLDLYRDNPSESRETVGTLRYLDLSLRALQDYLATNNSATVSDEAILCILYFAVNHQVKPRLSRDPSPFTPPRTSVHHLNIFGTTTFHPAHWKMAKNLIHARGGVHTLKMVTLPWLIGIADLLYSVGALEKPTFALLEPSGKPILYLSPLRALCVSEGPRHFSHRGGFAQMKALMPPVHQYILNVYLDLSEYSQCLDYLEQVDTCPTHKIGDCRDIVHHRFMSLPDAHDENGLIMDTTNQCPDACQKTRSIYLLLRLGALLYLTHVTFPLPRPLRLRKILLSRLSSYFASIHNYNFPSGVPLELFLWPTAIAAIASRDEPCRMQFLLLVNRLCRETGMMTWEEFRGTMRSLAWVDCACDIEGYHVWADAQLLG